MAPGADRERTHAGEGALGTTLVEQLVAAAALPVGPAVQAGSRSRDPFALGQGEAHGRSGPRRRTSQNRAPEPPFEHSATSAPSTWLVGHDRRSCWTPLITRWSCCALIPGWLNDMVPPSVVTGRAAPGPMFPSSTKGPPSPGAQKPKASSCRMISNENGS